MRELTRDDLAKLRACGSGFKNKADYRKWEATASEYWEQLCDLAERALDRQPASDREVIASADAFYRAVPQDVERKLGFFDGWRACEALTVPAGRPAQEPQP